MADLSYNTIRINDIEVSLDAPITEALLGKMGGAINYLLDNQFNFIEFTTVGNHLWVVPTGITRVFIFGCGAGGGGGSGFHYVTSTFAGVTNYNYGGGGGAGCGGSMVPVAVTPANSVTITIPAGGAINTNGGDTLFGTLSKFKGGARGDTAVAGAPYAYGGAARSDGSFGGSGSKETVGPSVNLSTKATRGGGSPKFDSGIISPTGSSSGGSGGAGLGGNGGYSGNSPAGAGTGYGAGGGGGYSTGILPAAGYQGYLAIVW